MSQVITVPFTEDFLPHVVDYIDKNYVASGRDLSRLCLVFGGRRPSLFIQRDLALRIGKAFVPPVFFTIDEWMAYVAYGVDKPSVGSELDHCYTLYRLACQLCPVICRGRESFVQFLPWAREILGFIEQLDVEDVSAAALKGIGAHAAIGFNVPEDINKLLGHIGILREAYHETLERQQWAPRGFQYRQALKRVAMCDTRAFDEIMFCNFFYLHRTESGVIKHIYDQRQAVVFVQGDQRRWPALTRIAETFGVPILEGKEVLPTRFDLKVYEAFDAHAQAGLVRGVLDKVADPSSTVIVLPDPSFLSTLLTAVGSRLEAFNVSMGYSIEHGGLYGLLILCFQIQNQRKDHLYYAKDYLRLWQHPLIRRLDISQDTDLMPILAQKIEQVLCQELLTPLSGSLFLNLEDIVSDEVLLEAVIQALKVLDKAVTATEIKVVLEKIHKIFLKNFDNRRQLGDLACAIEDFVTFMQAASVMDGYPLNAQIAACLQTEAQALKQCVFAAEDFQPRDLFHLVQERLSRQWLSLSGSPLRGLQVLGLFETRSLNFKHVIVVDVNEGFLPNLNIYEPLIPREVMVKLNLDRLELEEEIQRYGFMRLIAAAEDVHLVYVHNTDRARSRFIEELIWEREERAKTLRVVPIRRGMFDIAVDKNQRFIPKTAAMIDFLKSFKFSASSLNAYIHNPYVFYCRYLLGMKETEDLLEDFESRHVGIFIHDLLHEAFSRFLGKKPVMDAAFQEYVQQLYRSRFDAVFGKRGRSDIFLMEMVLKTRIERFFEKEAVRCQEHVKTLVCLERSFDDVMPLGQNRLHLTMRVDRVDAMTDGSLLILDYKTGSAIPKPKVIATDASWTRAMVRDRIGSFQMPLYLHCLRQEFPERRINSALYYLRTMQIEKFLNDEDEASVDQVLALYYKALDFIIAEIYNPQIPFMDDPLTIG